MSYVSLFSGIEAASVAWEPLGWEPVAFAEIEEFPAVLLAARWPGVPNLGDVRRIDWRRWAKENEEPDMVVGGSPCVAFSVAGLRKGLEDPRGNLMFEYLRAVDQLQPMWALWENVPGVLSDKTGAFAILVEAFAELGYLVDMQVLDALDFGVAQRRRRVFVLAVNARKGLADSGLAVSVGAAIVRWAVTGAIGELKERCDLFAGVEPPVGVAGLLSRYVDGIGGWREVCGTLGIPVPAADAAYGAICMSGPAADRLDILAGFAGYLPEEADHWRPEAMQEAIVQARAAAFPVISVPHVPVRVSLGEVFEKDAPARYDLSERAARGILDRMARRTLPGLVAEALAVAARMPLPEGLRVDRSCRGPVVLASGQANAEVSSGYCPTLTCLHEAPIVAFRYSAGGRVRRLTPLEAERLMGFPDGYTRIAWRGKGVEGCPDGLRYRVLGNSMAVPVMRWVGSRIVEVGGSKYILA